MRIIVVGAGEVGTYIAERLSGQEHHVALVESSAERFRQVETELEVVLLPLVAVDWSGNRLGHGTGYYDRTFAFRRDRDTPILIGLAHRFQVVESIEPSPWDVPVDLVVTETGIFGRGIAPSGSPMGED